MGINSIYKIAAGLFAASGIVFAQAPGPAPAPMSVPPQLTVRPGTFLTVRINQPLSSDRNQVGDAFSATLERPLVIDGIVVAQRGQTIGGRVVEARKAGRVEGVSRLGIQLTDLTLVDGQQLPIHSQLINRNGRDAIGRDAGALAGTTLSGAAVGAAVNGGVGAGVGAAAGLVVGTIGVLLTRGHPTVIYPESVLTFQIEAPVTIVTDRAPQVFRYVDPNEYDRPYDADARDPQMHTRVPNPCGQYGCPPPPPPPYTRPVYYAPVYAPYYPPYYGPSVVVGFGRGYYGRGHYRGYWR